MYKATKQWKPNKYMQHLMKDGMLYFFVYVSTFFYFHSVPFSFITDLTVKYLQRLTTLIPRYVFLSINIMNGNLATANNTISGPTLMVSLVLVVSMMSRFVISMRELYDRDIHGRWEGIDSAFGVLSQPVASTFVDVTSGQGEGQVVEGNADPAEVIPLMVLGDAADGTHQEV